MKGFNCNSEFSQSLKKPICPNCGFCHYCREFSCFHGEGEESKKVWINLRSNEKQPYDIQYLELPISCRVQQPGLRFRL